VLLLIVDFFLETSGATGWWCLFASTWACGGCCFIFSKRLPSSSSNLLPPSQAIGLFRGYFLSVTKAR
jgi:hypothetical protein